LHGWKSKGEIDVSNPPVQLRCIGGAEVEPQSSLTWALGAEEWSALFSSRFAGGKYPGDSLERRQICCLCRRTKCRMFPPPRPNACNKPDTSSLMAGRSVQRCAQLSASHYMASTWVCMPARDRPVSSTWQLIASGCPSSDHEGICESAVVNLRTRWG